MRIRLALAALMAVLSVPAGVPVAASATPAAVRVVTFNVCGNVCRHGEVSATSSNVAYRIRKAGASMVMLQELCYSQFLGIQGLLARYGYTAEFAAATRGGHCDDDDRKHGRAFGIALLTRGTVTGWLFHRLPNPEGDAEERVVLAARVRLPGRWILAATTHTSRGGSLPAQLDAIRRWLVPLAANRPLVFGGDLNISPEDPAMDAFYAAFHEANVDRENPMPTFIEPARKIDYLFGSKGYLTPVGVGRSDTGYSDHDMYIGAFR
ncbi:endonuclease/exonuclease/phosphatase family protein [Actinoplanes sp. KI2]|uniref:endonuclease/exonuclease/phosphatase family protein n=1 Tax=Actinoplanes sp. KI2 TaxID=2983315 RepID=UPI0021D5DDC6|nr:endonuclease/exonuclease/phosphatase family protein [Actinoplanes sp. KI2]MCU7729140.1 endonuclease/exonuclease/phosphatase family protein [Actinoplanes sp. KI2]